MMKSRRRAFAAFLSLSLLSGSLSSAAIAAGPPRANPESVGFSTERLKRLEGRFEDAIAQQELAGAVTLLARHGKIVSLRTYGKRAEGQPMTRDTIFRLASMSKPITGVAMMILFEEGKWRLDEPVTKFIPEFAKLQVIKSVDKDGNVTLEPMKRPPTMRELMSHSAGFAYGIAPISPAHRMFGQKQVFGAANLQEMIDRIATIPLLAQPGHVFSYSASVDIQGYIVEKLSGMRFSEFLQQRIFTPLKMVDTGFSVAPEKAGRVALMYGTSPQTGKVGAPANVGGGIFGGNPAVAPGLEMGGAGMMSTADDYFRFAQMLANKGEYDGVRILAPATVELIQTNMLSEETMKNAKPEFILSPQFDGNVGIGANMMTIVDPRAAGRTEGPGTISWDGATGVWWWADPANDVVFIGMIANNYRVGPRGFDQIARPLVYQALVDPRK